MKPDWQKIEIENEDISVQSASFLGEGWNSCAYLVNDELVFRFSKRQDQWDELNREIPFLSFAADKLPLAVPRYIKVVHESSAAPYGYTVYRYLRGHGMNVNTLRSEQREEAADAFAQFLLALHGLQPPPGVASLLPCKDERLVAKKCFTQAERNIFPKLPSSEATALSKLFEVHLSNPANFSSRPVVLHADLSRDHVLVEDGSIAAIIDFGDINWSDPDYDFMSPFVSFGMAFVEEVARRYGHPDFERLREKLSYFRLMDLIQTIMDGAGFALKGEVEGAWQRLREILQSPRGRRARATCFLGYF